jgi:hypothetical protein
LVSTFSVDMFLVLVLGFVKFLSRFGF